MLTVNELNKSFKSLFLMVQQQSFSVGYKTLHNSKQSNYKSKILNLSPLLTKIICYELAEA